MKNNPDESSAHKDTLDLLLTGLAAGDSLGSTSEFVPQSDIPDLYAKYRDQGWPSRQVGGGSFDWEPGQPTDDTDMAMCLVRSYRELGRFDGEDVARRFVQWMRGDPRDIGGTTRLTLSTIADGIVWHEGGLATYQTNPRNAANGSLMRNGVVPGIADDLNDAFRITLSHGVMTHYAPLPQLCCAAQTYLVWRLLAKQQPFASDWVVDFRGCFDEWLGGTNDDVVRAWHENVAEDMPDAWATMEQADWGAEAFDPFNISYSGREGYCLLTLEIAVWAVQWSLRGDSLPVPEGFPAEVFDRRGPRVLGWVAMIGHDSDTYGAATGPLIAAAHRELPEGLTEGLWVLET